MKVFSAKITVSGVNNRPDEHFQDIIAPQWEDAMGIVTSCIRDSFWVVRKVEVVETERKPFSLGAV